MGRQYPGKHDTLSTPPPPRKKICEASWIVFMSVWYEFSRRGWIKNMFTILTELHCHRSFLEEIL